MRPTLIILSIILYCNFSSCTKKNSRDQSFIDPLEISVPKTLDNNSEIMAIISTLEDKVNIISDEIETIAVEGEVLIRKEELEVIDALKVAKTMLNFYSRNTELQNEIEEFDEYMCIQEELGEMNSIELETLSLIKLELINRLEQLEHKYPIYYNR